MTLVEESAMKQSATGRHCEERSDDGAENSFPHKKLTILTRLMYKNATIKFASCRDF
jgi:hypothetical protein